MGALVSVNPSNAVHIEHEGQPVLTTSQLAEFYGCEGSNIKKNFNANKERFVEGKHYFLLKGEEFKNLQVTESDLQISPMARHLYLWTKQGAARHSKMLGTERAWEVFEALEETYFNAVKTNKREEIMRLLPFATPGQRKRLVAIVANEICGASVLPTLESNEARDFLEAWLADEKNAKFIIERNGKRCILPNSDFVKDAANAGFTRHSLLRSLADSGAIDISFHFYKGRRVRTFTVDMRVNGKKAHVIRVKLN